MYIYHIHNIGGQLFSAIEVCFYKLGLLMFIIVETPFFTFFFSTVYHTRYRRGSLIALPF